jgi:hypothetical protein
MSDQKPSRLEIERGISQPSNPADVVEVRIPKITGGRAEMVVTPDAEGRTRMGGRDPASLPSWHRVHSLERGHLRAKHFGRGVLIPAEAEHVDGGRVERVNTWAIAL